ncbi:unnamed protein product, partial [Linum tenue]
RIVKKKNPKPFFSVLYIPLLFFTLPSSSSSSSACSPFLPLPPLDHDRDNVRPLAAARDLRRPALWPDSDLLRVYTLLRIAASCPPSPPLFTAFHLRTQASELWWVGKDIFYRHCIVKLGEG